METSKNRGCGNISPQLKKPKHKAKIRKWEEMESYIFIVYIIFHITGGGLLVFFHDELTTSWNKNYIFISNVEKIE